MNVDAPTSPTKLADKILDAKLRESRGGGVLRLPSVFQTVKMKSNQNSQLKSRCGMVRCGTVGCGTVRCGTVRWRCLTNLNLETTPLICKHSRLLQKCIWRRFVFSQYKLCYDLHVNDLYAYTFIQTLRVHSYYKMRFDPTPPERH